MPLCYLFSGHVWKNLCYASQRVRFGTRCFSKCCVCSEYEWSHFKAKHWERKTFFFLNIIKLRATWSTNICKAKLAYHSSSSLPPSLYCNNSKNSPSLYYSRLLRPSFQPPLSLYWCKISRMKTASCWNSSISIKTHMGNDYVADKKCILNQLYQRPLALSEHATVILMWLLWGFSAAYHH